MHEYSLVRGLLAQACAAAQPLPASSIRAIFVSTGPLAGVETLLVQLAFEQLKTDWGLDQSQLVIGEEALQAVCRDCDQAFDVLDFLFKCPHCGSGSVRITQGDEFRLLRLEVSTESKEESVV